MRLEHGSPEELKARLIRIVRAYPELQDARLFFFGSRVHGRANERSDIDVGILADKPISPGIWLEIQDAVEELPFLYKVDVVDFARVSPEFRAMALEAIEEITTP